MINGTKPLISIVAGARPNFMKIAPIIRELEKKSNFLSWRLVHTGQHYDRDMSDVFFEELGIPQPHHYLDAGGGSHAEQTAKIMVRFEQVCVQERPSMVVVVGDVNSTLACSIVAKKLNIPVAHVEAGLRSGDMTMPEEVNRIVTDSISDLFFVTERSGSENLLREGRAAEAVHFVGHVMIDNLFYQLSKLNALGEQRFGTTSLKSNLDQYAAVTLHRPATVDNPTVLHRVLSALNEVAARIPIIFPVHPRTRSAIERCSIELHPQIHFLPPLPYMEFLSLWKDARFVLTDSGGLQEETTALGIPCLTIRENTERPITVENGSNRLVGTARERIIAGAFELLDVEPSTPRQERRPALWDGRAAERIVKILVEELNPS